MANPKRRGSKSRRDKRRSHWALKPLTLAVCPECQEPKLPHRLCLNCGHYKNQMILEIEEKEA
ncbi:MAG: 50S ribosomal protein L32 [bacterium]